MCPVIHGVDFPLRAGAVVSWLVQDPVHDRVTQVEIGM